MRVGAHISISAGFPAAVDTARRLACDCMQIFLDSPRAWRVRRRSVEEAEETRRLVSSVGLSPLVVHMTYLLNLSSPDSRILRLSRRCFGDELEEAERVGADYYVIHPGSHRGVGVERGISTLAESLSRARSAVRVVLENTAGSGTTVGWRWSQYAPVIRDLGNRIGLCLDTAHAFAAGYDLRSAEGLERMLEEVETHLGLQYIVLVHANDSASPLGSRVDRHAHLGQGAIGLAGLRAVARHPRLAALPFIIETPKDDEQADAGNLAVLRRLGEDDA